MKNFDPIENEIEQTLNALKGIAQAEPKPYFYTRLHARMERELLAPKTVLGWQFKPIYALSAVAILLVINLFTIFGSPNPKPNMATEQYSLYDSNGF